jgi:hypothetical protein
MWTERYKNGFLQCYLDRPEVWLLFPKRRGGWIIERCKNLRAGKARITRLMRRKV